MKSLNKNFFIAIFIFISIFCVGRNSLAADEAKQGNSLLKNFQIMPKAFPCNDCIIDERFTAVCKCDSGTAVQINDCLKKCIETCKAGTPASGDTAANPGYECYNNLCGKVVPPGSTKNGDTSKGIYQCSTCAIDGDCYLNDFLQVFVNIANIILVFSGVIGLLMLIYSSFQFLISAGDSNKIKSGMTGIKNVVIGLIIVFVAWTIVAQVKSLLGFDAKYNLTAVGAGGDTGTKTLEQLEEEASKVLDGCCVPVDLSSRLCISRDGGPGTCDPAIYREDNLNCEDMPWRCL